MKFVRTAKFLRLFALILPVMACPAVFAQDGKPDYRIDGNNGYVKVPFELYGNNLLVQFRINHSPPIWCLFDTGAGISILNDKLAATVGTSKDTTAKLNAGGGSVEGTATVNATISLAGATAYKQTIAFVPLDMLPVYFGRDVKGIIGTDFIRNFVVEIDHANRMLTLYDPKVHDLSHDPKAIPISIKGNAPYTEVVISVDGKKKIVSDFELDTGSSGTMQINRPFSEKNGILDAVPKSKTVEGEGGAGVGGDTHYLDARIDSIQIGGYTLREPIVSISQDTQGTGAGNDPGVIGTEILRRFTVVLDYRSGKMLLTPNQYFDQPFDQDLSGLELMTAAGNFKKIIVKAVRPGFPAAAAGLQPGDEILSINDRPSDQFDLDSIPKLFRQAGETYRILYKRGAHKLVATFTLKRLI